MPVSTAEHTSRPEMVAGCHGRDGWDSNPWHARAVGVLIRGVHSKARHLLAICVKVPNIIFNHFPLIWLLAVVLFAAYLICIIDSAALFEKQV